MKWAGADGPIWPDGFEIASKNGIIKHREGYGSLLFSGVGRRLFETDLMAQVLESGLPPKASSPNWLLPTIEKLSQLLALGANWDSYGAQPIDAQCVLAALRLLGRVMHNDSPSPAIVPTNRGGVQLEWHTAGVDLEIDVISSTDFQVCYESSSESWQRSLSTDLSPLQAVMSQLSDRA